MNYPSMNIFKGSVTTLEENLEITNLEIVRYPWYRWSFIIECYSKLVHKLYKLNKQTRLNWDHQLFHHLKLQRLGSLSSSSLKPATGTAIKKPCSTFHQTQGRSREPHMTSPIIIVQIEFWIISKAVWWHLRRWYWRHWGVD